MLSLEQRQAILAEAEEWRVARTPFRHCASIKAVGCDCCGFLHGCYKGAGLIPKDQTIGKYNWQHSLHRQEELFLDFIRNLGGREIPESEVQPADIVVYKAGKTYAHGGIVFDPWPGRIIHAIRGCGVTYAHGVNECVVQGRPRIFFAF